MQKICIINKTKNSLNKNIITNKSKVKRKFILVMNLFMIILSLSCNIILAADNIENFGTYRVYSYINSNRYIKYKNVPQRIHEYYYLDNNSKELPAYCMNLGLNGAETVEGGYNVNANEYLSDITVNNIILNGYPYKTVDELKLANESEARYATQFALWIKLNNLDINQIVPMEDTYQRVVDAIKNIYYNGVNLNYNYSNGVNIKEIKRDSILDAKDKNYYSKMYELEYGDNILDIDLKIQGINDYIITNENNEKINNIVGNTRIKILFPRNSNLDDVNGNITITCKYKETAVLFAKSQVSGMQDLSLTLHPIKEKTNTLKFKSESIKTKLIIIKKDAKDTNIVIPNVKFNLYDVNNSLIGEFVTDSNGMIDINIEKDLKIFNDTKIKIEEIEVPYPYIIDKENSVKIIEVNVGNTIKVEFKNERIKEKIKVELPKTGC